LDNRRGASRARGVVPTELSPRVGMGNQSSSLPAGEEGIITVATGGIGRLPPPSSSSAAAGALAAAAAAAAAHNAAAPPTANDLAAERAAQALLARLADLRASLPSIDAPAAAVPLSSSSSRPVSAAAASAAAAALPSSSLAAAAAAASAAPRDASSTAAALWADLARARRLTDDTAALSGSLAELVGEHREWVAGHAQALLANQQHLARALERCAAKGASAAQAARAQAARARASGQALAPAAGLSVALQELVEQVEHLEGRMEALEREMDEEEEEEGGGGGGDHVAVAAAAARAAASGGDDSDHATIVAADS
jgi:chaperonin cofactor prefoldin